MPRYDYKCSGCGWEIEVKHSFDFKFDGLTCPLCSARVTKVIGATPAVFKGSGFYKTDNRK